MGKVQLSNNGKLFSGWTSVTVERSIEQLAASFSLSYVSDTQERRDIIVGDKCEILYDDEVESAGYVEDYTAGYDARTHTLSVSGRSMQASLIDCAVEPPRQWVKQKISAIASAIVDPFGLLVSVDDDETIPFFSTHPGDKAFDALARLAAMKGILLYGDEQNGVLFSKAAAGGDSKASLRLGENIKAGSRKISASNRFSEYIVRSTSQWAGAGVTAAKASVKDNSVKLYRPVSISEQNRSQAQCKTRGEWERAVRFGKSSVVNYTVPGWGHSNGLWRPNTTVKVFDKYLGFDDEQLLIVKTRKKHDAKGGSTTDLELMREEAFTAAPLPPKVKKKDTW